MNQNEINILLFKVRRWESIIILNDERDAPMDTNSVLLIRVKYPIVFSNRDTESAEDLISIISQNRRNRRFMYRPCA
jgi:hypothetical protein